MKNLKTMLMGTIKVMTLGLFIFGYQGIFAAKEEFFKAVKNGNLEKVKELVKQNKALVNAQDKLGETALHWAVEDGKFDIVKELIKNGANIDAKDKDGNTPLHWAAVFNQINIVKYLIEKGANVSIQNNNGAIAYYLAEDQEVKDLLIEAFFEAVKNGKIKIVKECLNKGKTLINTKNRYGYTPLHWAVENGKFDIVKELIKNGANINAQNSVALKTPLHTAAEDGYLDILIYLIANGANINATDADGNTPLHWAAAFNQINIVKYLIEKGAKINIKNKNGAIAYYLAEDQEVKDLLKP